MEWGEGGVKGECDEWGGVKEGWGERDGEGWVESE